MRDPVERNESGFTLLELLVAMTLLGLVTVGLTSGIRFGTRVWEQSETRSAGEEDQQNSYMLLRRVLRQVVPVNLSQEPTAAAVTFIGEPRRFRLIGTAPAQSAPPGLYRIEVAIVETGGADSARSLMLRWQPLAGEVLTAPMDSADQRMLMTGLRDAAFAYFGTRESGWIGQWGGRVDLPRLLRLDLTSDEGLPLYGRVVFQTHLGVPEP